MRAHLITLYISEAGAITIVEFLRNAVNSEAHRLPRPSARPRRCRRIRRSSLHPPSYDTVLSLRLAFQLLRRLELLGENLIFGVLVPPI